MRSLLVVTICIVLCFFYLLGAREKLHAQDSDDVHYVSVIRLIANPEKYDGKVVQVTGFVHLEFEGNAVYLHEEDYRKGLMENALYLSVPNDVREAPSPYTNHYCLIRGTFKAQQGALWSGTIGNITRFQVDDMTRTQ